MTIVLLALFAAWQTSGGAAKSVQACTSAALVATWQVAYAKLVYQVTKDGTMNWAHGGRYTLTGDTYTETIQHGFGEPFNELGKVSVSFKCSMEGKDTWHISGKIGNTSLDETWKRVMPAQR
jgi:hypothetical protein